MQFEDIFNLVKENINPKLRIFGILETMTERTAMSKEIDKVLNNRYNDLVFGTKISRRIEAANSTAERISLVSNSTMREMGSRWTFLCDNHRPRARNG